MSSSHYDVLNATTESSANDIKRAYRRCALMYHPDKNASPEAAVMLARVQEAYAVLSDLRKRREYDIYVRSKLMRMTVGAQNRPRRQTKRSDAVDDTHKTKELQRAERESFENEAFLVFESIRARERGNRSMEEASDESVRDILNVPSDRIPEMLSQRIRHIFGSARGVVTHEELEQEEEFLAHKLAV